MELKNKTETEKIYHLVEILNKSDEESRKTVFEVLEEVVQSKYKRLIERRLIHGIEKVRKITNILPKFDQDMLQEVYRELLEEREIEKIEKLCSCSEIPPKFDENEVVAAYEDLVKKERIVYFKKLHRISGIDPGENLLNAVREIEEKRREKRRALRNTK
ncbi:MAG: hypothetical protein ACXQS7_02320 [Candidatus Syntropharchaeia archaeon]